MVCPDVLVCPVVYLVGQDGSDDLDDAVLPVYRVDLVCPDGSVYLGHPVDLVWPVCLVFLQNETGKKQ